MQDAGILICAECGRKPDAHRGQPHLFAGYREVLSFRIRQRDLKPAPAPSDHATPLDVAIAREIDALGVSRADLP